ncbi:hypothetical protein NDU88_012880 [Pleurodeles waltl]|uniref:Uncharacterized protein n=1 Tax=Pleurodeles waltl TaxID=8319 RepID=A0AAV7R7D1_PLEWA|nr:hypothetical protein NDU88_012880 [Pleurodeles waltl]
MGRRYCRLSPGEAASVNHWAHVQPSSRDSSAPALANLQGLISTRTGKTASVRTTGLRCSLPPGTHQHPHWQNCKDSSAPALAKLQVCELLGSRAAFLQGLISTRTGKTASALTTAAGLTCSLPPGTHQHPYWQNCKRTNRWAHVQPSSGDSSAPVLAKLQVREPLPLDSRAAFLQGLISICTGETESVRTTGLTCSLRPGIHQHPLWQN